jgi:glycosyltransferase involved in cell wall biosynthesis
MRVLHILNHTNLFNGNVNVAIDLACIQAAMGHTVGLINRGGQFDALLAEYGVEDIKIDQTRRPLTIARAVWQLHRAVQKFQPDIIHAHMMTGALLAWVLKPFHPFKLVTTVHNEFEKSAILMGLGDLVVGVSEAVAESMIKRGVSREKVCVIMNGVIGSPRLSKQLPEAKKLSRPAIGFVGGLHPRKGVDDLIEAFKITAEKVPEARLYIVGGGPYREAYEKQAVATGVGDRIVFFGGQKEPRAFLLGFDLFVLPSHADPAPLVLAEARGCGCAVIGTSVGGIPEMLAEGKAGVLVPPQRPDLLAEAMTRVLSDEALLRDLRNRAGEGLDYYTIERTSKDYLAHYEKLVAGIATRRAVGLP